MDPNWLLYSSDWFLHSYFYHALGVVYSRVNFKSSHEAAVVSRVLEVFVPSQHTLVIGLSFSQKSKGRNNTPGATEETF